MQSGENPQLVGQDPVQLSLIRFDPFLIGEDLLLVRENSFLILGRGVRHRALLID